MFSSYFLINEQSTPVTSLTVKMPTINLSFQAKIRIVENSNLPLLAELLPNFNEISGDIIRINFSYCIMK